MKISSKQQIGNWWFGFSIWINHKKTVETIGIQDICQDALRILFMEYDCKLMYNYLIHELKRIQKKFKLSNIYIFESSKDSYHCYCCCKFTSYQLNQILKETSCDDSFIENWRFDYISKVLRITEKGNKPKPKYLGVLKSKYNQREKSFAHLQFLKFHYNIPEKDLNFKNDDRKKLKNKDKILELIKYPTSHNVEKEGEKK